MTSSSSTPSTSTPAVEVLSETYPDGLTWRIRAWQILTGPEHLRGHMMTMLRCEQDGRITSEAGFGGQPLPEGAAINDWIGHSTGEPTFVMVRARPDVDSVVAVLDDGQQLPLTLSPVIGQFGLKFGAARIETERTLIRLDVTAH